jgi:lysophospholipase L1-like esterase
MATELKRMRQLIGSTAEWAANDLVIGDGEIAVERVAGGGVRAKVGNGAAPFSGLPYLDSALLVTLADDGGAGMIGFDQAQPYPPDSLGGAVKATDAELDALAASMDARQDQDEALIEPGDWGRTRELKFNHMQQGARPQGVEIVGAPASVVVNASGQLEVDADYASLTNRVYFPGVRFAEGLLRVKLLRNKFMLSFRGPDWVGRALWSSNGTQVEYGVMASPGDSPISLGAVALKGSATTDVIWIELLAGPTAASGHALVRSWLDGAARPAVADIQFDLNPVAGGVNARNEGALVLNSFAGTVAKFIAFQMFDGNERAVPACGQVAFVGRWFTRFDGGRPAMCTVLGGSKFRFRTRGVTSVKVRYCRTSGVVGDLYPVCDVYVDGVAHNTVTFDLTGSLISQYFYSRDLVTGLDPSTVHRIEVRVRGVNEGNDKYLWGAGLLIESLAPNAGAITPWPDPRPKMLFIGDSITEGIVARGTPSSPANSAGDLSWPVLAADMLGYQAVVNGYGGVGLTTPGSGGVPNASINAFRYMNDRAIDTLDEAAKVIVINLGTNDSGASVPGATFQAAYIAFLQSLLLLHPAARRIYAMRPPSGTYPAEIAAAVAALSDPRISYMDTSGWTGIAYTDGIHPSVAGHATMAQLFVTAVGEMQPGPVDDLAFLPA